MYRLIGRPPITSVDEKDVELALLDLIHTCVDFRSYLLDRMTGYSSKHTFIGAWRQTSSSRVITDTEVLFKLEYAETVALLIEYKVTHSEQPAQAERYRERGESGRMDRSWDRFWTCLIAPKSYFTPSHTGRWDYCLSLEEISDWLENNRPNSSPVLLATLKAGIEKYKDGGPPRDVDVATFLEKYWELCNREFPDLRVARNLKKPPANVWHNWVQFADGRLESLPKKVHLCHKPVQGTVDIEISATDYREIRLLIDHLKPEGARIEKASGSTAVRYIVPPIDQKRPFAEQEHTIRAALNYARILLGFWHEHRALLGFGGVMNARNEDK